MDSMMGGGSASADPRLQNEAEFFSRSGIEACLAGAAGAVLIKKIADAIDDDKKDKDKKFFDKETLLIAVGVCGVAMGANYYLETRRSQYANREQALNEMVKDAKADNAKLSSLIATTRQVVAEDKAEIDQVKRDIAAKKISRQDADKKLASVDANRAQLEKTLAGLRQRQQNWREIASSERQQGTKTAALDAEIATLNKQIASMESALFELNDYRKISAVG
ncbi:MAG: hypothetical protein ACT4PZ_02565 [Panacagrimonas sp.]